MGNPYNCVDVSEWNGGIDWKAAYEDDVKFAFIRCGFGQDSESQDDKYFHINMQNAIAAGVKVGVYFYAYATSEEAAIGEAEHCLRLISEYKNQISFPVFYDVEESKIESHLDEIIPAFINKLNEAGYNCGVYCTTWWFDNYFKDIACDYFWLASWGNDNGEPHTKPEWCDVWQYTSKGSVHGIGYDCVDCDILYNEDMKLLINQPDPKPEPTPSENEYTVQTKGDALRLRSEPNTSSRQVGWIPNGKSIKAEAVVEGEDIDGCNVWVLTTYDDNTGYASGKYLDPTPVVKETYSFEVSAVENGSTGADTLLCQKLLLANDFKGSNGKDLELDGICGNNTVYAIRSFQKANNLNQDGVCGQNTWKALLGV